MIKLNAGFSRKVGEANFGSRGASVNLELELDSGAVSDPEKLHERIRSLFALARKAVDEELRNGTGSNGVKKEDKPTPAQPAAATPPAPRPASAVCSDCGTDRMSEKVVQFSTEKFGKVLCYRCQKKLNGNEGRGT